MGAPIIGTISDKIGRKKTFLYSIAGTVIGNLLSGMAFLFHNIFLLIAGRIVTGFCAGNLTLCLASLADMSQNEKDKVNNFSQLTAISGISYIFAVLSADIFSKLSPSTLFWITSFLGILNISLLVVLFQETRKKTTPFVFWRVAPGFKRIFQNRSLNYLYICFFLFMLCWVPALQYLPELLLNRFHFSDEEVSIFLIALGGLWSVSNWLLSRFGIPFSPHFLFRLLLLLASFLILAGTLPTASLFLISFIVTLIGAAVTWTYLFVGISDHASLSDQGEVLGLSQSIGTFGVLLGLGLKRYFVSFYPHQYYLLAGILILFAALIASFSRFKIKS